MGRGGGPASGQGQQRREGSEPGVCPPPRLGLWVGLVPDPSAWVEGQVPVDAHLARHEQPSCCWAQPRRQISSVPRACSLCPRPPVAGSQLSRKLAAAQDN